MRPLQLKLKGFTSFRDEQTIDFRNLEVFAITGPTGSGKSSILDAMTYALYGQVERVGNQCTQLVSQGQARMTVTFDFRVGTDDYRITRSTPAKGVAHALLQRLVDGEARIYGDGADHSREINKLVARIVGLDYDAFTRSVMLPQGKFAEFLTGQPKKRRDILIELLGLELFDRLLKRANLIKSEARTQAEAKSVVIERQYAGVDADALTAAADQKERAAARSAELTRAVTEVTTLAAEWESAKARAQRLEECARESDGLGVTLTKAAEELEGYADAVTKADAAVLKCKGEESAAAKTVSLAAVALGKAERTLGALGNLARAKVLADGLIAVRRSVDIAADTARKAHARTPALAKLIERRVEELAGAQRAVVSAASAFESAKAALGDAEHADAVAALVSDLKRGDPCPICGTPLKSVPKVAAAALRSARAALARAEEAHSHAREALAAAKVARSEAERDAQRHKDECARLDRDAKLRAAEHAAVETELAKLFGTQALPADPKAEVRSRVGELERLAAAARDADKAQQRAERARTGAQEARAQLDVGIATQRARLEVSADALRTRVLGLKVEEGLPALSTLPPVARGVAAAARVGRANAELFVKLATRLRALAGALQRSERDLLTRAQRASAGIAIQAPDLNVVRALVAEAERTAVAAAATAAQLARSLAVQLEQRAVLEREVTDLEHRAHVFGVLAVELRADHIVAFLQAEALHAMALAASVHLAGLSEERYTLCCRDDDEFFVVDQWNGDEERSVHTLSGGETFLASLSLALALADQVRAQSAIGRARLDSLFLDEGFGTLDPEALRIATGAVQQLAGDGRLIGVVTHLRELADQLVRVQVEKSPRGSTLRVVG